MPGEGTSLHMYPARVNTETHGGRTTKLTCLLPSPDVTLLYRTLILPLLRASPLSGPPLSDGDADARSACSWSMRPSRFAEAFLASSAARKTSTTTTEP